MSQRGATLLELLIAAAIGAVVLLALGKLYVLATNYGRLDEQLSYMQRQGSLILDEMGRQVRASTDVRCSPASCDPVPSDPLSTCGVDPSLQVQVPPDTYCFRLNAAGGNQLIEVFPAGGQFNMLSGSPASLIVSECPGTPMFGVINPGNIVGCSPVTTPCAAPNRVDICFRLSTTSSTAPDSMIFRASFTRRN